jgi:hypothetical protein
LDLLEDGLGLLSLAGLNELREAIHRHGLFPLVLVILSVDYSNRYGGVVGILTSEPPNVGSLRLVLGLRDLYFVTGSLRTVR